MVDVNPHPDDNSFFIREDINPSSNIASWTCLEFGPVVVSLEELVRDYGVYLTCSGVFKRHIAAVQKFKIHLVDPSGSRTGYGKRYLVTKVTWDQLRKASSLLALFPDRKNIELTKIKTRKVVLDGPSKTLAELLDERIKDNQEFLRNRGGGTMLVGNQTLGEFLKNL
jgi:hypothetical protein